MPHILHSASKLAARNLPPDLIDFGWKVPAFTLLPTNQRARLQSVFLRGNEQSPRGFGMKTPRNVPAPLLIPVSSQHVPGLLQSAAI